MIAGLGAELGFTISISYIVIFVQKSFRLDALSITFCIIVYNFPCFNNLIILHSNPLQLFF